MFGSLSFPSSADLTTNTVASVSVFYFPGSSSSTIRGCLLSHQWLCGCMRVAGWTCRCECLCMPVSPGPMRHWVEMQGARSFVVRLLLLICWVFAAAGYPFKAPLDLDVTPRVTVLSSGKHGHNTQWVWFCRDSVSMGCKSGLIKIQNSTNFLDVNVWIFCFFLVKVKISTLNVWDARSGSFYFRWHWLPLALSHLLTCPEIEIFPGWGFTETSCALANIAPLLWIPK